MQFAHFDFDAFLSGYWQQKPLLIRNPWRSWTNPLEPDELAGLACEEDVESRLVERTSETWKVEHGPIAENRFGTLGKNPWTLLVQAVDIHAPDVAALIEPFRFIPDWRIDDVMVSYASDGGGVGPHFDQYDVFLIQGLGTRRWQVGALCDGTTALLPHDDLRLLADFETLEEWVLEPGDILYLPPRVAHNGVAVGDDCMTYSIGFRAPSRADLIENWSGDLIAQLPDDDRYQDPGLLAQDNPGEISPASIATLHAMVVEVMNDRDAFARWFGQYNSGCKYPEMDFRPDEPLSMTDARAAIAGSTPLSRNPASRFSYVRQDAGVVLLFVDGRCFDCRGQAGVLARQLCATGDVSIDPNLAQSDAAVRLIADLFNQGSLAFEPED